MENSETESPHATGASAVIGFTGNGQEFTLKDQPGRQYKAYTVADLLAALTAPVDVDKEKAPWAIFSDYRAHDARRATVQRQQGSYNCLWADIDKGSPTQAAVVAAVKAVLGDSASFVVYHTKSTTAATEKHRVVAPLAVPVAGAAFHAYQQAFNEALEAQGLQVDRSTEKPAQLCYLPNRGQRFEYHNALDGELFDATVFDGRARELYEEYLAKEARQKERHAQELEYHKAAFMKRHPTVQVLEQCGFYTHDGVNWRYVDQTSPSFATELRPDGSLYTLSETVKNNFGGKDGYFSTGLDLYAKHMQWTPEQGIAYACRLREAEMAEAVTLAGKPLSFWTGNPLDESFWSISPPKPAASVPAQPLLPEQEGEVAEDTGAHMHSDNIRIPPLSDEVMRPNDLFGELVNAVYEASRRPNLLTAMMAATSFISTTAGGRWCGQDSDDRLRMWWFPIGGSGSGKETAITGPSDIATAVISQAFSHGHVIDPRLGDHFIAPPGSSQGLEKALTTLPSPDVHIGWDEVSSDLAGMLAGRDANKAGMLNYAVSLHGKADKREPMRFLAGNTGGAMYAPNVNLTAATVEELLAAAIDEAFMTNGTGARLLMMPTLSYALGLRERKPDLVIPAAVVASIARIRSASAHVVEEQRITRPMRIQYADGVSAYFHKLNLEQDSLPPGSIMQAMSSRKAVNAKALACVRALICGTPVTLEHAQWAETLVKHSDDYKVRLLGERLSYGTHDAAAQSVLRKLGSEPDKWFPRKVLTNGLSTVRKLKDNEKVSLLKHLEANGQIVVRPSKKGTSFEYRLA